MIFFCTYKHWLAALEKAKYSKKVLTNIRCKYLGTSVLNPGAGFLRIFTVAFDILGQVRLG